MGVSKNRGVSPKMDGEKNGNFPIQMDDLGGFHPLFSGNISVTHTFSVRSVFSPAEMP